MKWLVIQSDGQHKGQDGWSPNWHLRECYVIQDALLRLHEHADIWGLRHTNYEPLPDFNRYDGVFTIENYELDWLPDLSGAYRCLRVYWLIDAHWQPISAFERVIPCYDIVLHSTRRFVEVYAARFPKQKHIYFPNGVDDRYFEAELHHHRPHTVPLIFIGGKAEPRAAAINQMIEQAGLRYAYGITGQDYIQAVLNAKIHFNKGLNGDINYRNWETVGLGTCLLTEYDPEMEALGFRHDVNCLFYRNVDEAVQLAKTYLANGEWERVAKGGAIFAKEHSYKQRVSKMLKDIFQQ
jgi:hypothetical protein